MYNRYKGNGTRPVRMEDYEPPKRNPTPPPKPQLPQKGRPKPPLAGGGLGNLIPKKLGQNLSELETEDLLLILILYLMYRESGDKELLIIMGAMYLL